MNQHIETVVIGGGQAGLATGYHLKERGRPFVILEAHERIGDQWRRHYDSLVLFSARKYDALPGLAFPGEPYGFPTRDEVASYLETYAAAHDLPVRTSTPVERVSPRVGGGFRVAIPGGTITCDNVVIAAGKAGQPKRPAFADQLDPRIVQMHSSEYRNPGQLPEGPVLVVGASHSGADIALELSSTHPVTLVGRDTGQIPFRPEDRRARRVFPVVVWAWKHVLTRRTPIGRKMMGLMRAHGAPLLRTKTSDLVAAGVERIMQRVAGVRDGRPVLDDGTALDPATVIWATGFGHSFGWVDDLPLTDDGWPAEYRGVVEGLPGLYFCGLIFQYAFSSMVLPGVARDSAYVVRHLCARPTASKQPQAA